MRFLWQNTYRPVGIIPRTAHIMNKRLQRSQETRSRLLQAAEICFAEDGYDATGVAKICQTAGVSKGAFYHHFSSKQALFLELLQQWLERLDSQLGFLREEMDSTPEALMSMAGAVQQVLQAAQGQLPIYLEFWNRAMRDTEVMQALVEPFHHYHAFFTQMIQEGIHEGTLREVNADTTARTIMAVAIGLLFQGLLERAEADYAQKSQESIQILLKGLER